jgi:putative transposase
MLGVKSVRQNYPLPQEILGLLEFFRRMVNDSISIGLANNVSSLRRLSLLSYNQLASYDIPSYYKLCAISRAAGILAARKKSIKRGHPTRTPYAHRPLLISCYGFKIINDQLQIPVARGLRFNIPLTKHTVDVISQPGITVRSFTLTRNSLSLCIARDVSEMECVSTLGVDRNLRNLTVGNLDYTIQYDLSRTVQIAETTSCIVASFHRDDVRIRRRIASKYGRRRKNRISHLLHNTTKTIVSLGVERREAIVLENIEGIRSLYRKGNGQGKKYRRRMNSWSYAEAQRQIEYKARWVGLPTIRLSKGRTRGTSIVCPRCGERLQSDKQLRRKLWCVKCRWLMDRDEVGCINIALRGRLRFDRSQPTTQAKGEAVEAMKENPTTMVISRVDAPKLAYPTTS